MNDDTGHEYTDGYNDGYSDCKKEREAELAALRLDASSKWAFLEWRDRAEKAEAENAALREQLEDCKSALRELDLTGIQYQEKPVDAVGRMRGIAMAALNRLT